MRKKNIPCLSYLPFSFPLQVSSPRDPEPVRKYDVPDSNKHIYWSSNQSNIAIPNRNIVELCYHNNTPMIRHKNMC